MDVGAARLLTVDLGNSYCKLRVWEDSPAVPAESSAEPSARARLVAGDGLAELLGEWLDTVGGADRAAVASVADRALTERVVGSLEALLGGAVAAPPDPGLALEVERPETVGEDRLFAARGAVEHFGAPAIVVDVGTALTVDAVGWTPSGGVFLGGAIAPGPYALARALAREGNRLPEFEPEPGAPALGRDTPGALRAGVAVGLRGAARALVESLAESAPLRRFLAEGAAPRVALAGGARAFLLAPEPFCSLPLVELPDVVHCGLRHADRSAR